MKKSIYILTVLSISLIGASCSQKVVADTQSSGSSSTAKMRNGATAPTDNTKGTTTTAPANNQQNEIKSGFLNKGNTATFK